MSVRNRSIAQQYYVCIDWYIHTTRITCRKPLQHAVFDALFMMEAHHGSHEMLFFFFFLHSLFAATQRASFVGSSPEQCALVDYWLEWESSTLQVR